MSSQLSAYPLHGSCSCAHASYTLTSAPLIVHACHCTECRRESGSAFALNALYEPERVICATSDKMLKTSVPSERGGAEGQIMYRCPQCYCVLWSTYAAGGHRLKVVRVGTIDDVRNVKGEIVRYGGLRPDAHLFADAENEWMDLQGERVYEKLGKKEEYWSKESLERWKVFTT